MLLVNPSAEKRAINCVTGKPLLHSSYDFNYRVSHET